MQLPFNSDVGDVTCGKTTRFGIPTLGISTNSAGSRLLAAWFNHTGSGWIENAQPRV